jgi:hypothetical protein
MRILVTSLGRGRHACALFAAMGVLGLPSTGMAQSLDSAQAIAPPREELAGRTSTVKELMREGVAAYRKKDYERARSAFARALQLERHIEIAAFLAESEMKLALYSEAAEHWEYNLERGGEDHEEAMARLAECKKHIAQVSVELEPVGADLFIDGVRSERRNKSLWFAPGTYALEARQGDRRSAETKLTVAAGEERKVQLIVPAAISPAAPPAPPKPRTVSLVAPGPAHDEGLQPRTIVVLSGAALTVAAIGLGVYSELQARSADSRRKALINQASAERPVGASNVCWRNPEMSEIPSQCSEIADKVDETILFQNLRTASFITAGALGVATVATFFLWPAKSEAERARRPAIAPMIGSDRQGVQFRLRF